MKQWKLFFGVMIVLFANSCQQPPSIVLDNDLLFMSSTLESENSLSDGVVEKVVFDQKKQKGLTPKEYFNNPNSARAEYNRKLEEGVNLNLRYFPAQDRALKEARTESDFSEERYSEFYKSARDEMVFSLEVRGEKVDVENLVAGDASAGGEKYGLEMNGRHFFNYVFENQILLTQDGKNMPIIFYHADPKNDLDHGNLSCVFGFDVSERTVQKEAEKFVLHLGLGKSPQDIFISKFLPEMQTNLTFKK